MKRLIVHKLLIFVFLIFNYCSVNKNILKSNKSNSCRYYTFKEFQFHENAIYVTREIKFIVAFPDINPVSEIYLDSITNFFIKNKNIKKLEIGVHLGYRDPALSINLSESRAKNLAKYMIKKGFSEKILTYKGYENNQPLVSDSINSFNEDLYKINNRVEFKIIAIDL